MAVHLWCEYDPCIVKASRVRGGLSASRRYRIGTQSVLHNFINGAPMSSPDQLVHYQDADIALTGVLYGHDHEHELPGILLIHGGAGLDEHARQQGRRWAALGYVVFVCDMYGDGVAGDRQ